nr:hypothetical protein [Skermanella rosea]
MPDTGFHPIGASGGTRTIRGKKLISIGSATSARMKGIPSTVKRCKRTLGIEQIVYIEVPIGGVTPPIVRFTTITRPTRPKCTGYSQAAFRQHDLALSLGTLHRMAGAAWRAARPAEAAYDSAKEPMRTANYSFDATLARLK